MEFNIEIKELQKFVVNLRNGAEKLDETINKSIKKGIFMVQGEAITRVPVDTGLLKASHRTEFSNLYGILYNTREYGIYVHDGTKYIKANPWMKDALDYKKNDIRKVFNNDLENLLENLIIK